MTHNNSIEEIAESAERLQLGEISFEKHMEIVEKALQQTEERVRGEERKGQYPNEFTFDVVFYPDGWSAQCREVPAISTGGNEIEPSQDVILNMVEDAILSAMGKKITLTNKEKGKNDTTFPESFKRAADNKDTV